MRLSPPDQLWVEILSQELYHCGSVTEIRAALVDKHPQRIIDAVIGEIGAKQARR